jgi:DNA-binding IclR family transcriptional regulator
VGRRIERDAAARRQALARDCGESSFLGVASGPFHVEYIAKVVSTHELRCDADLGQPRPLNSTSVGLVLLAFQPEERSEQYLKAGRFEKVTADTIADATALRRELGTVRERGYSIVRDTNSPGAAGIACPIFDGGGQVIAALNVSAPTARFDPIVKQATQELMRAAEALSRELASPSTHRTPSRKSP